MTSQVNARILYKRGLAFALLALCITAGCSGSDGAEMSDQSAQLRISSFDFAESELLGELYAQTAEAVGIPVTRLGATGPREIVSPALESGAIDLVPEYAGTALMFHNDASSTSDDGDVVAALNQALEPKGLTALAAASAFDTNVFVVAAETARSFDLTNVSDLRDTPLYRFGGPAECPDRPLCLAGLRDVYGLTFDQFTAHPSLSFTAEALRRDEVDVGLLFSTSPELDADDLTPLHDDLGLQPADNIVPVARVDALTRWPELEAALDRLSQELTTEDLRRLNQRAAAGVPVADVAAEWLGTLVGASQ